MKYVHIALIALGCILSTLSVPAQEKPKKRLLVIGMSAGFQHDSVSDAMGTLYKLGKETGLWDTYLRTDTQLITKKKLTANARNLDYFDALFFMTTGEIPLDEQQKADLLSFVQEDGKGFLGAHNATDTLYQWPAYGEMIGGYFDMHPWNTFLAPVIVVDRHFPGMEHFPQNFTIQDEIYQTKNFVPEKVRVLMTLDTSKVDMKAKNVKYEKIPITWVKNFGKGRVFYCGLGHLPSAWERSDFQKMWVEAVKWSMGLIPGDATPNP